MDLHDLLVGFKMAKSGHQLPHLMGGRGVGALKKSLSDPGVLYTRGYGRGGAGGVIAGVDALEILLVFWIKGHDFQLPERRAALADIAIAIDVHWRGIVGIHGDRATAGGAQRIAFLCDQGTIAVDVEGTVTRVDRTAGAVYGKEAWAIEREIVVIAGGHQSALLKIDVAGDAREHVLHLSILRGIGLLQGVVEHLRIHRMKAHLMPLEPGNT